MRSRWWSKMSTVTLAGGLLIVGCAADTAGPNTVPPPPPPPPPPVGQISYASMDDVTSISALGGTVVTTPANDFVTGRTGMGLRADDIGERALIPQVAGGTRNIENERGTLEFWYQPNYDATANAKYTIAGTGTWKANNQTAGSIHLGHHNDSNNRALFLILFDANGVRWEHDAPLSNYGWSAGEWKLIRITWDMNVAAGERNLHLYIDGQEIGLVGEVSRGPQPAADESPSEMIYIGARDTPTNGNIPAGGVYDDVRIWDSAIPPS